MTVNEPIYVECNHCGMPLRWYQRQEDVETWKTQLQSAKAIATSLLYAAPEARESHIEDLCVVLGMFE